MELLLRTFRAKLGRQGDVAHSLVALASAVIRHVAGTTVLILRVENDPTKFVWLGDRGSESDFARLMPLSTAVEWLRCGLAVSTDACTLRLIDEHHCPLPPPYQLWNLQLEGPELRDGDVLHQLREAPEDPRVIGTAVYRSVEEPRVVTAFLGLAWGVTPSGIGLSVARFARATVSGALTVVVDGRRLASETPPAEECPCEGVPEWIRHLTSDPDASSHIMCAAWGQQWSERVVRDGAPAACIGCGAEGYLRMSPQPAHSTSAGAEHLVLETGRPPWY